MSTIYTQRGSVMKKTTKILLTISTLVFINMDTAAASSTLPTIIKIPEPTAATSTQPEPKKINRCGTPEPTSAQIEADRNVINAQKKNTK